MKKILLVSNGYPSETNPQYMPFIRSIEECIELAGHQVDKLVLDTNFTDRKSKYINYFKYYRKIFLQNYKQYDIVYVHIFPFSFPALLFRYLSIKKLIIHWHGVDIFPRTKKEALLNKFSYFFINKAKKHFVPSYFFKGEVVEKLSIAEESIVVSPSGGIDTDIFIPLKKDSSDIITIGYASNMTVGKGVDLVAKLIDDITDLEKRTATTLQFVLIDYGKEARKYKQILEKYKYVKIINPVANEKMVDFYNSLDILLFPTKLSESLGLVGLEAMSCNVPVVGTDDFAIKDYVVSSVSGEKFDIGDYKSFKQAVVTVILSINSYNPRKIVLDKFSKKYVVTQYMEVFS